MTYKAMYERALKFPGARELAPVFVKWEEEGQTVVGRLVGRSVVRSRQSGGEYADYVVETDEGAVHFACGNQFDEKVGHALVVGKVYAWTFKGKRDIGQGRRVNDFSCLEIPDELTQGELPLDKDNPL